MASRSETALIVALADSAPDRGLVGELAARYAPVLHLHRDDAARGDPGGFVAASRLCWKHTTERASYVSGPSLERETQLGLRRASGVRPEYLWRRRFWTGDWTAPGQNRIVIRRDFAESTPRVPSGFYLAHRPVDQSDKQETVWYDAVELPGGGWDIHYWLFFPTSTPPDELAAFASEQVRSRVSRLLHSGRVRAEHAIARAKGDVARAAAWLHIPRGHLEWARRPRLDDLEMSEYTPGKYLLRPSSLRVRIDDALHEGHRLLAHQGDWEQVTIRVAANRAATDVFFNYHTSAVVQPYDDVVSPSDGRVHAWIARGSHASYPSPDEVDRVGWGDRVSNDIIWDARESLLPASGEPWYGFGGGWGDAAGHWLLTYAPVAAIRQETLGPVGPCRYRRALDYLMHERVLEERRSAKPICDG